MYHLLLLSKGNCAQTEQRKNTGKYHYLGGKANYVFWLF